MKEQQAPYLKAAARVKFEEVLDSSNDLLGWYAIALADLEARKDIACAVNLPRSLRIEGALIRTVVKNGYLFLDLVPIVAEPQSESDKKGIDAFVEKHLKGQPWKVRPADNSL